MHRNGTTARPRVTTLSDTASTAPASGTTTPASAPPAPSSASTAPASAATAPGAAATAPSSAATASGAAATASGTAATASGTGTTRLAYRGYSSAAAMDVRLHNARLSISALLNDEQNLAQLAPYGYTAARLQEGLAIQARAFAARAQQRAEQGALLSATDAYRVAQTAAQHTFALHSKIAQIALHSERGLAQTLGLGDTRARSQAKWQQRAQRFYTNALANSAILEHMASYGITAQQLVEGQRQVTNAETALVARQQQRTKATAATSAGQQAFADLDAWMRNFQAIVRIAFPNR